MITMVHRGRPSKMACVSYLQQCRSNFTSYLPEGVALYRLVAQAHLTRVASRLSRNSGDCIHRLHLELPFHLVPYDCPDMSDFPPRRPCLVIVDDVTRSRSRRKSRATTRNRRRKKKTSTRAANVPLAGTGLRGVMLGRLWAALSRRQIQVRNQILLRQISP